MGERERKGEKKEIDQLMRKQLKKERVASLVTVANRHDVQVVAVSWLKNDKNTYLQVSFICIQAQGWV